MKPSDIILSVENRAALVGDKLSQSGTWKSVGVICYECGSILKNIGIALRNGFVGIKNFVAAKIAQKKLLKLGAEGPK